MFYIFTNIVVGIFLRICFKIKITGKNKLPKKYLLVCNHTSNWDPPVISTTFPTTFCFVAKEELFRNKVWGFFLRKLNVMPVNRKNADIGAVKASLEGLKKGLSLIIFPEGTRHGFQKGVPIKPGFINLAYKVKIPIVPVSIKGNYKFRSNILITINDPIYLDEYTEKRLTNEHMENLKNKIIELIRVEETTN